MAGSVSNGYAWQRHSQSYFDSENGVPWNTIVLCMLVIMHAVTWA